MHRMNETVKHYAISRPTAYKWVELGCPVHYVGSIPYFDWDEVDQWIKNGTK